MHSHAKTIIKEALEQSPFPEHDVEDRTDGAHHHHRYDVRVCWNQERPSILVIMLFPGKIASASEMGGTVFSSIMKSYYNHYGRVTVMNLYSCVTDTSKHLRDHLIRFAQDDAVQKKLRINRDKILRLIPEHDTVLFAWGCAPWIDAQWLISACATKAKSKTKVLCVGQNASSRPYLPTRGTNGKYDLAFVPYEFVS